MKFVTMCLMVALMLEPSVGFAKSKKKRRPPPPPVHSEMIQDLEVIKDAFAVKYAPAEWKGEYANWDLLREIEVAKERVRKLPYPDVKKFQRIVRDFFNSTKDYHTSVHFYSTEMAFLPFQVKGAEGRYFVTWVDKNEAGEMSVGDEVLALNGQPIREALAQIEREEYGNPDSATDHALAQTTLTVRLGSAGNLVPKGKVEVQVLHRGETEAVDYSYKWKYFPELIRGGCSGIQRERSGQKLVDHPFLNLTGVTPHYTRLKKAWDLKRGLEKIEEGASCIHEEGNHMAMGDVQGFLPPLGPIVWESPTAMKPFRAYIFQATDGRNVGYIRVPSFIGVGSDASSQLSTQAFDFATLINVFQQSTDGLIIDQLNNPGGVVFYMYALAAMLSDAPLAVPSQRLTITQKDVYQALDTLAGVSKTGSDLEQNKVFWSPNVAGYPITPDLQDGIIDYAHFILDEWQDGRTFTRPCYLYGLVEIGPHPSAQYTRPILILCDHLDFSCGDFFPAILQDNGRATILGTKTAGAGGFVVSDSFPNLHGVEGFHYTGSIALRANGKPIENLGVTPDVEVNFTAHDLQNGFEDYIKKVNETIHSLMN